MLRWDGGAFKKSYDSRIVHPGAQDRIEREAPPSEVIVEIFLFERMWSFVCNLPSLSANVQFRDVALFGEFDPFLVRKFGETPEHATASVGSTVVEAVTASLLLPIADREVSLPAQSLDRLIDRVLRLATFSL